MTDDPKSSSSGDINVGDINHSAGVAIGHGAKAIGTQTSGSSPDEIAKVFAVIMQPVKAMPEGAAKEDATEAVKKLEAEARRGEQADESRVRRWFEFLAETSVDAWEVAVNTFINPVAGVGTVFKKIAERAKAEKANKEAEEKK